MCPRCGGFVLKGAEINEWGYDDKCLSCGHRIIHWWHDLAWIGALPIEPEEPRHRPRKSYKYVSRAEAYANRTYGEYTCPVCGKVKQKKAVNVVVCPQCRLALPRKEVQRLIKEHSVTREAS